MKPITASEAQKRATKKWREKSIYHVGIDMHRKNDADIVSYLERSENKSKAIKKAIRAQIEREKEN